MKIRLKKASIVTKLILLALVLYAAVSLATVHAKTAELRRQQAQLQQQVETLTQDNAALAYQIEHSDDADTIEEIVRDKLGLVKPGEKIFYDTSN